MGVTIALALRPLCGTVQCHIVSTVFILALVPTIGCLGPIPTRLEHEAYAKQAITLSISQPNPQGYK